MLLLQEAQAHGAWLPLLSKAKIPTQISAELPAEAPNDAWHGRRRKQRRQQRREEQGHPHPTNNNVP